MSNVHSIHRIKSPDTTIAQVSYIESRTPLKSTEKIHKDLRDSQWSRKLRGSSTPLIFKEWACPTTTKKNKHEKSLQIQRTSLVTRNWKLETLLRGVNRAYSLQLRETRLGQKCSYWWKAAPSSTLSTHLCRTCGWAQRSSEEPPHFL